MLKHIWENWFTFLPVKIHSERFHVKGISGKQFPSSREHSAKTFFYGSLPTEVLINIFGILLFSEYTMDNTDPKNPLNYVIIDGFGSLPKLVDKHYLVKINIPIPCDLAILLFYLNQRTFSHTLVRRCVWQCSLKLHLW